jgi:hypothetical protein
MTQATELRELASLIHVDGSNSYVGVSSTAFTPTDAFIVKDDGARITVESADMEVAMLGRRGSSGAALDDGYLRLRRAGVTADGVVLNTDGLSWINGGNLGIGNSSPTYSLHLDHRSASNSGMMFVNAALNGSGNGIVIDSDTRTTNDNADKLLHIIDRAGDDALAVNVKGFTGIGYDSPATQLHIATKTGANAHSTTVTRASNHKGITLALDHNASDMVGIHFATGSKLGSHWSAITGSRSDHNSHWGTQLNFYTHDNNTSNLNDATQKMIITGHGRVGIGSNLTSPNASLHIGTSSAVGDATNPAVQIGGVSTYRLGMFTTAEGGVIDAANGDDGLEIHTKNKGKAFVVGTNGQLENYNDQPTVRPVLAFDFANSEQVDARIEFTRNSTATFVNKHGMIELANANVPRITYNPETKECLGFLIEGSVTNSHPRSENSTNWTGQNLSTITNNTTETMDPRGTYNAIKITETATTGAHRLYYNNVPMSSSQYHWWSVWVKPLDTCDSDWRVWLETWTSGQPVVSVEFNLFTGQVEDAANAERTFIEKYPNGWYRIGISRGTGPVSSRNVYVFSSRDGVRDPAGETDHGCYIWGAQVESRAKGGALDTNGPGSYVPTTSTALTKVADVATYSNIESHFPTQPTGVARHEFSVYAEAVSENADSSARVWQLTGNGAEFYDVYTSGGAGEPYGFYTSGSAATTGTASSIDQFDKILASYKTGDSELFVNGSLAITRTIAFGTQPISHLYIGQNSGGQYIYGKIKEMRFYGHALTDAEAVAITE